MSLALITGRDAEAPLDTAILTALRAEHPGGLLVDVGTGDGRFVLRAAAEDPCRLCLGLDSAPEQCADSVRRARRKPAKGGLPNALFVRGAAEALPDVLAGQATAISVNYPWGSLLRGVTDPMPGVWLLNRILALAAPAGAALTVLINLQPFGDPTVREAQGLVRLKDATVQSTLLDAYAAAGVRALAHEILAGEPDAATSWGRRLVRGAGRQTLVISGQVG